MSSAVEIRIASLSNPLPSPGDLFYLVVSTLEEQTVHITAVPSGFYVNKSTGSTFDPNPAESSYKAYTLVDTLKQVMCPLYPQLLLLPASSSRTVGLLSI